MQAVAGVEQPICQSLHLVVMKNLSELAHSRVYMLSRGHHVCSLLASTLRFGNAALLQQTLQRAQSNAVEGWFTDLGGSHEGFALALVQVRPQSECRSVRWCWGSYPFVVGRCAPRASASVACHCVTFFSCNEGI